MIKGHEEKGLFIIEGKGQNQKQSFATFNENIWGMSLNNIVA